MPYIGTGLVGNFASTFRDEFTGDGSNTNFTLSRNAHHENDLEVFVGNVRQQPGDAYTVSGTTLAFTGTPANGEVIYVVHQAGALQTVQAPTDHGARDFNITGDANKITFGNDSEITITHVADSGLALKNTNTGDDKPFTLVLQTGETDIAANDKLGVINFQAPDEGTGTDAILVAAGIEAVSEGDFSSSSNATKLSFKTASSAAAAETMSLSSGGNLTVSGNVSVGGDLDVTGSFDMSDANITNVGSITLDTIANDGSDGVTIDSSTDVIIDAGGADIILKDDGTEFGRFTNNSTDFEIKVSTQDKDIKFIGDDGGSAITALSLDMSAAGDATFNNQVIVGDGKLVLNSTAVTSTAAELNILDGVTATTAEVNILDGDTSASSVTIVDADQIILNDAGTMKQVAVSALNTYTSSSVAASSISAGSSAVNITTTSGNITIDAAADNTDIIFKGTDDTSDITMLTLDGSAAGEAIFNAGIVIADAGNIGSASDKDAIAIAANGVTTFSQAPVLSGASITAGTTPLTALDIDGATDIGAAIADADLFIVDDGAGGTNRKVAASRLVTYIDANSSAASTGKAIAMAIVFG